MFNIFKKSDACVARDVLSELKWDPSITAADVGVSVERGIVTLRGSVPHYYEKFNVESAVQRVRGVRAVADELEVNMLPASERTDEDIAEAAIGALKWNYPSTKDVKISVAKGIVTLTGEAEWEFERRAAANSVTILMGVKGVDNQMTLADHADASDIKKRIQMALTRSAASEGRNINIDVKGDRVTLSGDVNSFAEIEDAKIAAWCAPGVRMVENNLRCTA